MKFDDLGLNPKLLKAIDQQGYKEPTPIQEKSIPEILAGHDVMAAAQTGTGKTASFVLPILHYLFDGEKPQVYNNEFRVLIVTPTRELAAQIADSIKVYGQYLSVKSTAVFGGVKINPQMQRLRGHNDILIATPGRLLDLHKQNAAHFDGLEILVLDEADRMLDLGFIKDVKQIISKVPKDRQTLLFSATFSDEVREIAKKFMKNPVEVSVAPPNATVDSIKQRLISVDKSKKTDALIRLLETDNCYQILVFARTKHGADKLTRNLIANNIEAVAIHGNKSQGARTKALANFKAGKNRVLIATDIASRGIDISQLPRVVNFDLPDAPHDYIHRIGRTGRAGLAGEAISLVSSDEFGLLRDIENLIKKKLPREELEGLEPKVRLSESNDVGKKKPNNKNPRNAKFQKPLVKKRVRRPRN